MKITPRILSTFQEVDEDIQEKTYNETIIDEPIGFDALQTHIQRHEYHGMGAEVSMGELEFWGNAIGIIRNAFL